jgi:hypothetical protein
LEPQEDRSLWDIIGKPVVITLSFILIFTSVFLLMAYLNKEPPHYDYYTGPTGAFDVEYDNSTDTYRVFVISLSEETLEIDEVTFILKNNNNTVSHDLPTVLDNDNNNVTFYDVDNDGLYSIGDEFTIDEDIVEPNTVFKVIWNIHGISVMETEFGE